MSIRKKMAEGAAWAMLEKLGTSVTSFVVFIIIARFVGPEEYGLAALCYIYLELSYKLFTSIVDGVVNLHINDDLRLSSLFWSMVFGGLFLSTLCFFTATPLAAVVEQPELGPLLRWFSCIPFLVALASVPTVIVTNAMNFRIFTLRSIVATLLSGIVGVVMAVKGFGAYAIVAQQIVLYAVINAIIWPGCGWRPCFMFSVKELMHVLKPGIKMSGSLLVSCCESQMPRFFIGHFLGVEAVGYFSFIIRIWQSFQEVLVYPLHIVSYPALSRLLGDTEEQKRILTQLITLSEALVLPCTALIIVTAPIYVPLFFSIKWNPAIPPLQIFLMILPCLPLLSILQNCLRAYNRMGTYLKMQSLLAVGNILLAWLLAPYGLVFIMAGIFVFYLLSIPLYIRLVSQTIKITLWQNLIRLWGAALSSLIMAGTLYAFNNSRYHPETLWMNLATNTVLACLIYAIAYSALELAQVKSLVKFFKELIAQRDNQMKETSLITEDIVPDLPRT